MLGFCLLMLLANAVVTGFARIPLSTSRGHHPTLEKWFGRECERVSATTSMKLRCRKTGSASRPRCTIRHPADPATSGASVATQGWWYYYLVALAVKVPLTFWVLVASRLALARAIDRPPVARGREMTAAALHRALPRYHGVRLVAQLRRALPAAAGTAGHRLGFGARREPRSDHGRGWRSPQGWPAGVTALVGIHPYELTYFNVAGGRSARGPSHPRRLESRLGPGTQVARPPPARAARISGYDPLLLWRHRPGELRRRGQESRDQRRRRPFRVFPASTGCRRAYLAVSASLQWGPWGPPGFFRSLDRIEPVRLTDDTTIAIYRTADLRAGLRRLIGIDVLWRFSVQIAAARQPVLQSVGQLGDAPNQAAGVDRLERVDRQVFDDDEVLFAAQDSDGEVPFDDARVELEQGAAIAVVDRPADRDQAQDRAPSASVPAGPT